MRFLTSDLPDAASGVQDAVAPRQRAGSWRKLQLAVDVASGLSLPN
jgi:hypothetical protein